MPTDHIPYRDTGYFSPLICDYLDQKAVLAPFYRSFPSDAAFLKHAKERQGQFNMAHRDTLVQVLNKQYEGLEVSNPTQSHIDALKNKTTVTITTGHQLNLFSGPLYFLYKIIATINLAQHFSEEWEGIQVVPIFWMATEDHDFEEINYFNLHGKKFQWNPERYQDNANGAVGHFTTKGLEDVLVLLKAELGIGINAKKLISLFEAAYLKHSNLADATRYLANQLFKDYGLVILDADDAQLKAEFIPAMHDELCHEKAFKAVSKTIEALQEVGYDAQVTPRDINLFYLKDALRERIVNVDDTYGVQGTNIIWKDKEALIKELQQRPERFSPNVIMRPLYQETILPNICYIGGGGEIAYWLELKNYFAEMKVPFPILLLRNSVLLKTEKQTRKLNNLRMSNTDIFLKQHELINRKVRQISNIDIDFSEQREFLKAHFKNMYALAEQTDASFLGAVKAQEVKQLKGLDHLEKRLLKAQRLKLKDEVTRIANLQNELFPLKSLQERQTNFSEFYEVYGDKLIATLIEELNPLHQEFLILTLT